MSPRSAPLLGIGLLLGAGCVITYDVDERADASTAETSSESDTDVTACAPSETLCGGACVDLDTDPDHCGGCDNPCDPGFACDRRECRDSCRDGKELCGRYCVDTDLDELHCGDCDQPCALGEICLDRTCTPP